MPKLIICHKHNNFRALKETNHDQYIAGPNETSKRVSITPANINDLVYALVQLGVFAHQMPNIGNIGIVKIAGKFVDEIYTLPGGNLAWDESVGAKQAFYKFKILDEVIQD